MKILYKALISRCAVHETRIDELRKLRPSLDDWTFDRLTESLMSDIWQTWCLYCRNVVHASCRGGECLNGAIIVKRTSVHDNSWKRLGYEARNRKNINSTSVNGHHNFLMRYEPTWGDLSVMIDVIQAINPINKNQLLIAFGMGLTSINHLQKARNACAHKNVETISELSSQMVIHYNFSHLKKPSELAWSFLRGSHTFAFHNWLFEMRTIAMHASSKL